MNFRVNIQKMRCWSCQQRKSMARDTPVCLLVQCHLSMVPQGLCYSLPRGSQSVGRNPSHGTKMLFFKKYTDGGVCRRTRDKHAREKTQTRSSHMGAFNGEDNTERGAGARDTQGKWRKGKRGQAS